MLYEELLKSNLPLVTLEFINRAINKYNYIKNKNNMLDEEDCVDLSFLFTCLIGDLFSSTKDIFLKYGLDTYSIVNYYKMGIVNLDISKENNVSSIYDEKFKKIIDDIIKNKSLMIDELYPEDILIGMIEAYFCNDFLYGFGMSDSNIKLLKEDLIENREKRKVPKNLKMDYNKLIESKLPNDTKILLSRCLDNFNIFFNLNNYNKSIFSNDEIKIRFTIMYTIIKSIFHKEFVKKNYNLNGYNILKKYELLLSYDQYDNVVFDTFDEEVLYNKKFQDFINTTLITNDLFKELNYDLECIYPESFYIAIGFDNDFACDFYKRLGFTNNEITNLKKDMHVSLKERILGKNINKKYEKYFNISDYADTNTKRLEDKIYDDDVLNSENNYKENDYLRKHKDYSILEEYGYFLDEKDYVTNPAIGRESEIKKVILSLLSQNKSSILVGPAGVGKTAIVEGIAYLLKTGNVPEILKNKKIISISTTSLVSGCQYVGMIEERMNKILKELDKNKDVIMFIDEIHTIVGAGKGKNGNNDISNILKPYLDRGSIKIIGATTNEEYDNIMIDSALRRRFETTIVKELDANILKKVLYNEIDKLENIYNIKFDYNDEVKENILNILINLTNSKNQTYYDKENNPSLILNILDKSFVLALYENRNKVTINDIKESINMCDKIYESVKAREISKLDNINIENNEKGYYKVIKFSARNIKDY